MVFAVVALEADGDVGAAVVDSCADPQFQVAVVVDFVNTDGYVFVRGLLCNDGFVTLCKCRRRERRVSLVELFFDGLCDTVPRFGRLAVDGLRAFQPALRRTNLFCGKFCVGLVQFQFVLQDVNVLCFFACECGALRCVLFVLPEEVGAAVKTTNKQEGKGKNK